MPNISFSTMREKLVDGEKTQTVRPFSKFWIKQEIGTTVHGFWKLRKKGETPRLFEGELNEDPFVIKGREFTNELAMKDGFEMEIIEYPNGTLIQISLAKMVEWFYNHYGDDWGTMEYVVLRWKLLNLFDPDLELQE